MRQFPQSRKLAFKRETSNASRYITATYSVTNKSKNAVLGLVRWNKALRKYSFYPESNCVFDSTDLIDVADFCEWLTMEHKSGNKKTNLF